MSGGRGSRRWQNVLASGHMPAERFPTLDAHLIDLLRSLCLRTGSGKHLRQHGKSKTSPRIVAIVTIPQDIAWRICTKGIERERVRKQVPVTGDAVLNAHVLDMLAIVG